MTPTTPEAIQPAISLPMDELGQFCRRWHISEMALFGSVLRDDFRPDSDIDVLVAYSPDWAHGAFEWFRMHEELEAILGRNVDLVSRPGLERSRNRFRRDDILNSARVIYAA